MKYSAAHLNGLMLPETASEYEVVDWVFGPLIHYPAVSHLGAPRGRVNLVDLTPQYAARLVAAGFPHLRKKTPALVAEPAEKPAKQPKQKENSPE